jgi:putative transposase
LGLSCRDYGKCTQMIPEVFGLSPSTVSRRFIKASSRKLKELKERRLDDLDVVGVAIDGKTFQQDEMIIALGVTTGGQKVILGFIQAATENASVCKYFFMSLWIAV